MPEEVEKPKPIVLKPVLRIHGGLDQGTRIGRGFSRGELKAVGLDIKTALKLGIPVDKRRRSIHQWNIDALKQYLEKIFFIRSSRTYF